DVISFPYCLCMFVLNHVCLRQIQSYTQNVGAVRSCYSRECHNQIAERLLGLFAFTQANVAKSEPLLESEPRAFVEHGQNVGLLHGGLKTLGRSLGVVIN